MLLCGAVEEADIPEMPEDIRARKDKPPKTSDDTDYPPLKKDLPYIRCSVCQKMAGNAYASVQKLVDQAAANPPSRPKRKGHRFEHAANTGTLEDDVDAVMDRLCDIESEEGKWMAATDIIKVGTELVLDYIKPGSCRRECRTMQRACEDVVESVDDEMPAALIKAASAGQSVGMAAQRVCNKLSKVCKKGATPPYLGKRKNEEFWPFTDHDLKMHMAKRMMDGMQGLERVNNPVDPRRGDEDLDGLKDEM